MTTTVTTSEAARMLGLAGPDSARTVLRRLGIQPVGRTLSGEKTWPADEIRAAIESRPGQGARTDLAKPKS